MRLEGAEGCGRRLARERVYSQPAAVKMAV